MAPAARLTGDPTPSPDRVRAVALALASAGCFAAMATCVGAAHSRDPALTTTTTSFARASVNLVILVVLARGDRRLLFGDGRPALWARGALGALSLWTYFGALARLDIGEAAFLNGTSAVWVALAAPWMLGEPASLGVWAAIAGSVAGTALLARPDAGAGLIGRALGLASGAFAAGAYVSVRTAARTNAPITIVTWFTLTATLFQAANWLAAPVPLPRDLGVIAALVGSGVWATLGQLAMTRAYQLGEAALVASACASGPLLTAAFGALFLGQRPDSRAAAGIAVLVVSSILLPLAQARATRRVSDPP